MFRPRHVPRLPKRKSAPDNCGITLMYMKYIKTDNMTDKRSILNIKIEINYTLTFFFSNLRLKYSFTMVYYFISSNDNLKTDRYLIFV